MSGSPDLSVDIGPMKLKNPVMPASGTFGYGQEYSEFLDLNRLGAIIVKTITLKPQVGSYPHRSTGVACGFLANIGLQNVGVDRFIEEKLPYFDSIDSPLVVSIGGQSVEEFVEVANILNRQKRVNALEVNISCPNVDKGGMQFGVDREVTRDLVKRVRDVTEKGLIVKLTPMVTDIRPFAEICQVSGADAVSLINAPVGMAIDINTRRSKLGRNMTGGLVGPAIRPFALYLVWQASKTIDIPVIGIGGISSAEDAIEFFIAGASAIEIGTWNFINPSIMIEVIDGIQAYMVENKIQTLSELIGTLS
ncbi:MAG: dihydroorotate dehydrogenase [Proteobacteria bacterium]|nr:dihydroorotate dehydrogenase [Pseudomonadota bacterium]